MWILGEFFRIFEELLKIIGDLSSVRKTSILLNFVGRTSRFQIEVYKSEILRPLWPPNNMGGQI